MPSLPTLSAPTTLPPATLIRPQMIPEIISDNESVPKNLSEASRTFGSCSDSKADCLLLSPANSVRWERASSRARVGLDIGGTLCEVVYFEPFNDFASVTRSGKVVESSHVSLRVEHRVAKMPTVEVEHERHALETFQSPENRCCLSVSNCCDFDEVDDYSERNSHGESLNVSQDEERTLEDHLDRRTITGNGHAMMRFCDGMLDNSKNSGLNAKKLSQVQKFWVSSHDPVIIPGRGALHFKCFETWRMEEFLYLTKEHNLVSDRMALGATGGGARKFESQFLEIAGLRLNHTDELKSLVRGIDFLMKYAQHESFEYMKDSFQGGIIQKPLKSPEDGDNDKHMKEENTASIQTDERTSVLESVRNHLPEMEQLKMGSNENASWHGDRKLYPYLVVNIGSGVSILLVESPEQFKRVGGTSLGGSTFFGLTSILTGCSSFEEAIELAAEGDSTEIDMLVGDIYGSDYFEMGLAATTVASSFGKLVHPTTRATAMKNPQHLAKAALLMITNNIGSLAKLYAQATGVQHVLFTGSFMHGNKLAMRLLTVAMEFWSEGQIKATFLRHEGHAGAMGALLSAMDPLNQTDALLLGS